MGKKKYYAVVRGRKPGIYTQWFGANGAEAQVKGFPNAVFKGFTDAESAKAFIEENKYKNMIIKKIIDPSKSIKTIFQTPVAVPDTPVTTIYTDGGCTDNPGPGGWGAVILQKGRCRELSGGFRLTTNNRMELTACIMALKTLEKPARVHLHTDSRYVADGITKGWAKRWRKNNWMRTRTERARNADLWAQLLSLCEPHHVDFIWVKGHAGHPENERCDRLAGRAARKNNLPADAVFEQEMSGAV
jgi:ribonuclease HI